MPRPLTRPLAVATAEHEAFENLYQRRRHPVAGDRHTSIGANNDKGLCRRAPSFCLKNAVSGIHLSRADAQGAKLAAKSCLAGKFGKPLSEKRIGFRLRLGNSALGLTISSGIMRPTLRNHGHVTEIRIFFRELERQIPLDFRLRSGLDVQKYALRRLKMPVSCFARGSGHGIAKLRD